MRETYSTALLLLKAARAAHLLAKARMALRTVTPELVLQRNISVSEQAAQASPPPDPAGIARKCEEAAFFVSRMARRVPWRSDCLVQALAGQNWLVQEGIASEIVVGTAKQADGTFLSHAWLRHGPRIILGGDISIFNPLLEPGPP
jgi:Transglutaminase-like superfamily